MVMNEIHWQPAMRYEQGYQRWLPCAVALGWGDTVWLLTTGESGLKRLQCDSGRFLEAQSYTRWHDAYRDAERMVSGLPYKPVDLGPQVAGQT